MIFKANLKKRRDFVRISKRGQFIRRSSLVLQALSADDDTGGRVGYTASKKIGNACVRNRAKRRLRAVVGDILTQKMHEFKQSNYDLVLIARYNTATINYEILRRDFSAALATILRNNAISTPSS